MMSPALTTEEGLQQYLESRSVKATNIKLLTGGTANYVYRATFTNGPKLIYKHAAPYLHSNAAFAFDPSRMDYEHWALATLPSLLTKELPQSNVHSAQCHSYDPAAKLLCISDGGDRNLKDAYSDPALDIQHIGKELGHWIAALHVSSRQTCMSVFDDANDLTANNPIAVNIYRHSYRNLHAALEEYGHDVSLAARVDAEFGSKLATDNECVCHGDFWPGNLLVKSGPGGESVDLTIVDWELVRRGTGATDVGQFAAEAYLLDRFRGGRGLVGVFIKSYLEAVGGRVEIGREWVRRMVVHWAVHVAFWPTQVPWTDREGTQKLVDLGVSVLELVLKGDMEGLRKSELFHGVEDVIAAVWDDA